MHKYLRLLSCIFLISTAAYGSDIPKRPTVCLNMIVKDEKDVIERCLRSVEPILDYWVIVDTGSSDNTKEIIKKTLSHIPGKLYERPWINFGHNRQEAMELARGTSDYLLFIDADEKLSFDSSFSLPLLTSDYYYIPVKDNELQFSKISLISTKKDWQWVGELHEQLQSETAKSCENLDSVICIRDTNASARSKDPLKYQKDAQILERALDKDPNNTRNLFYLGQSYANAQMWSLALKNYEKRASMEGCPQEKYWASLMIGVIKESLNYPKDEVIASYNETFTLNPSRAEPLYCLSKLFVEQNKPVEAYCLARLASSLNAPEEEGYVDLTIYEYKIPFIYAKSAVLMGQKQQAKNLLLNLVQKKTLPQTIRDAAEKSLIALN